MKIRLGCFILLMSSFTTKGADVDNVLSQLEQKGRTIKTEIFPEGIPRCTQADIEIFCERLNLPSIPEELKEFFLKLGHLALPMLDLVQIQKGVCQEHAIQVIKHAWAAGVPKTHLPFCADNGDYICINLQTGEITWWLHDTKDLSQTSSDRWPSFNQWALSAWQLKH